MAKRAGTPKTVEHNRRAKTGKYVTKVKNSMSDNKKSNSNQDSQKKTNLSDDKRSEQRSYSNNKGESSKGVTQEKPLNEGTGPRDKKD
jgi:hypothetical protein